MAFLDKYTPTQYCLVSLMIQREPDGEGGYNITATFELALHNAAGMPLTHGDYTVALSAGEIDVLRNFIGNKLVAFEAETGLARLAQ